MASAAYTYLSENDWDERIGALDRIAAHCELCPRRCGVDRPAGERGFCGAPAEPVVSSIFPHHGEEPPISGTGGSGTVFFTYCTLKCVFCQNYQLSHEAEGRPFSVAELAQKMLGLQRAGCHNINLVTPTHFLPWLMRAVRHAAGRGAHRTAGLQLRWVRARAHHRSAGRGGGHLAAGHEVRRRRARASATPPPRTTSRSTRRPCGACSGRSGRSAAMRPGSPARGS